MENGIYKQIYIFWREDLNVQKIAFEQNPFLARKLKEIDFEFHPKNSNSLGNPMIFIILLRKLSIVQIKNYLPDLERKL